MYSKALLKKYIREKLRLRDSNMQQLAKTLGIQHSNLIRGLESEKHNLTITQFSQITIELELTPEQVYHILTGKKGKEAAAQLVNGSAKKIVNDFLKQNG